MTLSPSFIKADGASTTTATATIPGSSLLDTVTFASTDPAQTVSATSVNLFTGTFSATITSSTTLGSSTITATDTNTGASGLATLIQYGTAAKVLTPVMLSPPSIVADGISTTTATATVQDAQGDGVPVETVTFSPTPTGPVMDNGDGTYTATIQSTTVAGPVTVTATDTSVTPNLSGTTLLIQTPGPATSVAVVLAPPSIPADGTSSTIATATVRDANNNLVSGDPVGFFPTDSGDTVVRTAPGNGTYNAQITSSKTPGNPVIVAVDLATSASGQATLTQTSVSTTTALTLVPSHPVTNQTETMVATVTASQITPSGTVAFDDGGTPISGCDNVAVVPAGTGAATATCQASFAAANSPVDLTAAFTPNGVGNPTGSTSSPANSLSVGKDSTSSSLTASSGNPTVGSTVDYRMAVVPNHAGPTQPSGSVQFTDGNNPLAGCASQPVQQGNSPTVVAAAVCRVHFGSTGTHAIFAHYLGDGSFTKSDAPSIQTTVRKRPPPGRLSSMLQWTFDYHPTYTGVPLLMATGVPAGATVVVKCHGQGCPYAKRTIAVSNLKACKTTATRRCTKGSSTSVGLFVAFRHHRLKPGTQVIVEITRAGWIAKYYRFTMRAGQAPGQVISCLAPGRTRPGVGCS